MPQKRLRSDHEDSEPNLWTIPSPKPRTERTIKREGRGGGSVHSLNADASSSSSFSLHNSEEQSRNGIFTVRTATVSRIIAPSSSQYRVQDHVGFEALSDPMSGLQFVVVPPYSGKGGRRDHHPKRTVASFLKTLHELTAFVEGHVLNSSIPLSRPSSTVVVCLHRPDDSATVVMCGLIVGKELSEAYRLRTPEQSEADRELERGDAAVGDECRGTLQDGEVTGSHDEPHHKSSLQSSSSWERQISELGTYGLINASSFSDSSIENGGLCGVELVWVHHAYARQHIATRMVHCLRRHLVYGGYEVPVEAVAFSQPTEEGKLFAAGFTGRRDFLVFI